MNVKIFIYHAGGISGKNMLVISRKMHECFDVTLNKWFIGRYKNQCNQYKNKKIYSFYHPILTKIFDYAINNNISTLEAANILAERRIQDYINWNHQ